MKKKNQPVQAPAKPSILRGDVFHAFITEATALGNELAIRRANDEAVVTFLREKGLEADFVTWRASRVAPGQ